MIAQRFQNKDENSVRECTKKRIANFHTVFGFNNLVPNDLSEYSDEEVESDEESDWSVDEDEMQSIDICNFAKPLAVSRYAEKIFQNDQALETKQIIGNGSFESVQKEVTPKNRYILVKWIISVHHEFGMTSETLFNAVKYVDIVLSKESIPKNELQLLGATCLWMASKVDERKAIKTPQLVEMCNSAFTAEQFCQYERKVLEITDYNLQFPTAKSFLRRYLTAIVANDELIHVSSFLCEISLLSLDLQCFRPSVVALAVITIALLLTDRTIDVSLLLKYSHFTSLRDAREAASYLIEYAEETINKKNGPIYNRYKDLIKDFDEMTIDAFLVDQIPLK